MSAIIEKWTPDQREAIGRARADGVKARTVADLAAAGRLELDGCPLDEFGPVPLSTIRDIGRQYQRRRAGEVQSQLVAEPPRDAIEHLRQRLINVADAELKVLERQKGGARNLERLRQAIRCVREAAAIPGRDEAPPVAPGQRGADGQHNGGATRGGLGAQVLESHRRTRGDEPAPPEAWSPPEPPTLEPMPGVDPVAQSRAEFLAGLQDRVARLVAQAEPQIAAPAPAPYRTLPTAQSPPDVLAEAAKRGWDPLRPNDAPAGRRRRVVDEDNSDFER